MKGACKENHFYSNTEQESLSFLPSSIKSAAEFNNANRSNDI